MLRIDQRATNSPTEPESRRFGTAAREREVIAYYDQQLRALGWTRDDLAVAAGSTDLRARG